MLVSLNLNLLNSKLRGRFWWENKNTFFCLTLRYDGTWQMVRFERSYNFSDLSNHADICFSTYRSYYSNASSVVRTPERLFSFPVILTLVRGQKEMNSICPAEKFIFLVLRSFRRSQGDRWGSKSSCHLKYTVQRKTGQVVGENSVFSSVTRCSYYFSIFVHL